MEISAKTGENIVEAVEELLRHTPRKGVEYPSLTATHFFLCLLRILDSLQI